MTQAQIKVREDALQVLRLAREWVKAGNIVGGRENVGSMVLDAIYEAPRPPKIVGSAEPRPPAPWPVQERARAYLCLVAPGLTDPGTSRLRFKKLLKWSWCQYVTQDHIIGAYEAAVKLAVEDIRECKAAAKAKRS